MTRKTVLSITFLSITGVAVGMEVWFAVDRDPATMPWTEWITTYVPAPVTFAAIAVLLSWLSPHFIEAYARKRGKVMTTIPATPEPGAEKEPLVSRALIIAVASAAIDVAIAFGVPLTNGQRFALLGLIAPGAVLVAALWARRKAFSPATVRAMVVTAAATGEVATEPTPARVELD